MAFSELVLAGSSFQFAPDGRHVVTRNYMHGSIWDVRQSSTPLRTFEVHEHLWSRLVEAYDNESIFDHLGCAVSPNGQHVALGSYCDLCVFNLFSETFTSLKACGSPSAMNVRCLSMSRCSVLVQTFVAQLLLGRPMCLCKFRVFLLSIFASTVTFLPSFGQVSPGKRLLGQCLILLGRGSVQPCFLQL